MSEKDHQYKSSTEELTALIGCNTPIVWVLTHEEDRFINNFTEVIAEEQEKECYVWSQWQGLVRPAEAYTAKQATGTHKGTGNVQKALDAIIEAKPKKAKDGICFLMRDFHTVLQEPIPRRLRDMYEHLYSEGKTIIIVSPILAHGAGGKSHGLPPTLEKQISVVHFELPDQEYIKGRIEMMLNFAKEQEKYKTDYSKEEIFNFTKALSGLTASEVDNSLASCFTYLGRIDQQKLVADKKQIIRKSDILEFVDSDVSVEDVGGLDLIKDYMSKYSNAHSEEAKAYGVEALVGVLVVGIPGTGKSLLAKVIGRLWGVPLLRLDVGKVMTGLVGGSEGKMREVIMQTESMSPCVLWIDEVEKSLSGTKSSNFSDGGTLARVFGTLLTAMQDGMKGVTIVATANDISLLPPEFIRRFNEVFFVDLPGPEERQEILEIHLKKRNRNPKNFSEKMDSLVTACDGYTGAEIEKAIKDAIAAAYYAKAKDVTPKHIKIALEKTKPISVVMADKVKKMRQRAKGQYRYASSYAESSIDSLTTKTKKGKVIDMKESVSDLSDFLDKDSKEKSKKNKGNRFQNIIPNKKEEEKTDG